MCGVRGDAPNGNQAKAGSLDAGERVASEEQKEQGEVCERAENVGHEKACVPGDAGERRQECRENQIALDRVPRGECPDNQPQHPCSDKALKDSDGPGVDVPMKRQDREAIEKRAHPVVVRKLVEEDGARYGRSIGKIGHGVGHEQRKAVVDRRPQEKECGQKNSER